MEKTNTSISVQLTNCDTFSTTNSLPECLSVRSANVPALNCSANRQSASCDIETDNVADENIASFLISWSHKHNITHSALDDLLHKLQLRYPNLPKDSRTLLQTSNNINVVECAGGSYIYFGLEEHIIERALAGITSKSYPLMFKKISEIDHGSFLSITCNVDGLPVHSSTTYAFWPILCILDLSVDRKPFIFALYYGQSKPTNANDYLRPFIDECLHLQENGLLINGKYISFYVSCMMLMHRQEHL